MKRESASSVKRGWNTSEDIYLVKNWNNLLNEIVEELAAWCTFLQVSNSRDKWYLQGTTTTWIFLTKFSDTMKIGSAIYMHEINLAMWSISETWKNK
jgi:hypothetical protein